jgi:hypothetical protein
MPGPQISSRVSAALTQRTRWRSLLSHKEPHNSAGSRLPQHVPPASVFNPPRKPVGMRLTYSVTPGSLTLWSVHLLRRIHRSTAPGLARTEQAHPWSRSRTRRVSAFRRYLAHSTCRNRELSSFGHFQMYQPI